MGEPYEKQGSVEVRMSCRRVCSHGLAERGKRRAFPIHVFETSRALGSEKGSVFRSSVALFPTLILGQGTTIKSIITEQGQHFSGGVFIDATIEGDLLAAAGVTTTVGRESSITFGEVNAGVRVNSSFSQLTVPIDPYVIPGDPASGLIPTVQGGTLGAPGSGYV